MLPSLQETPSDIRDLSHRIDSDGHGVDLDNNYHRTLQAPQSLLTKTGIEVSSGGKREASEILSNGDNRQKGKVSSVSIIIFRQSQVFLIIKICKHYFIFPYFV